MKKFSTEADARILIDDLLRKAGWDPADKSQVLTEVPIHDVSWMVAEPASPYGESSSDATSESGKTSIRRADYILLDRRGRSLAVIEAKRSAIEPYTAKQQTLPYAEKIGAPFIFLTNGELIYFWDSKNDDARIVNSFYSRRDLERLVEMRATRKPLATVEIPEYYIRQGETRQLRPYQREAMKALDHAVELGKRRFLIELPTGTGKTDLICLYLKRLFQAGRAERVLFLVDREQLAKQALEAVQDILSQYSSYWLRPGMARQEQQITVCLLQTMISRYPEFTSGYFDVVIADECHRSIYGAWQTALTHFDAFHIGLTATPSPYIERNTFKFYQCPDNQPDFAYSIQQAFSEGYLVPYKFATGITVILAEGAEVDDETYDPIEFERKWTNEDTNRKMMEEFDKLAWENYKELAPGQKIGPGKAIVFAITKHHAARLAYYLNELHPELKGQYATDVKGDIFEYLLTHLGQSALNGQFRTPRQIRTMMVEMVDPDLGDTIYDPACGTGGFLIDAVQYILAKYSSDPTEDPIYGAEWLENKARAMGLIAENEDIDKIDLPRRQEILRKIKEQIPTLQTYRKGPGEKIPDWGLLEHSIYGIDVSRQMMRIAMMNLVLHGIRHAMVKRANTLSEMGGLSEEDLNRRYKVILSNPPFAGVLPKESIRKDLPTNSKKSELLFLGVMMEALAPGGRCAVVVPEGLLFGSTKAHITLRRKLVEDYQLLAVVSLPAGVFKPYAGVKTGVLVFRRPLSIADRRSRIENNKDSIADHKPSIGNAKVWFYEVRADGFDPDKIQGGGRPETPERNDIPDLLAKWKEYKASDFTNPPGVEAGTLLEPGSEEPRSWWATIKTIADNDYNLAAGRYKPLIAEKAPDEDPAQLIRETLALEKEITAGLEKLLREIEL